MLASTTLADTRAVALAAACATAGVVVAIHARRRLAAARRQLAAARYAATHDPLTGLLNREGLARAWPGLVPARPVVALLDLDGFKAVNDQYGHAAGDALLTAIAGRLYEQVHGVAARLGGDEFVAVLLTTQTLPRLAEALAAPVTLPDGATVRVSASIGTSHSDDQDLTAALARSDAAMYRAKATGGGIAAYDPYRDDRPSPAGDPRPRVRVRDLTTPVPPTLVEAAR